MSGSHCTSSQIICFIQSKTTSLTLCKIVLEGSRKGKKGGGNGRFSLAGQQSHDVPVTREYTELHQVSEHTENLQQELLQETGFYMLVRGKHFIIKHSYA